MGHLMPPPNFALAANTASLRRRGRKTERRWVSEDSGNIIFVLFLDHFFWVLRLMYDLDTWPERARGLAKES